MKGFKLPKINLNIPSRTTVRQMSFPQRIVNNFGLKPFGGRNDLDFDGVPNRIDCQPRNTMRQDSQIYLDKDKSQKGMFVRSSQPKKIFIGQGRYFRSPTSVANLISHEETHQIIEELEGRHASSCLDNICPPIVRKGERIINVNTAGVPLGYRTSRDISIEAYKKKAPEDVAIKEIDKFYAQLKARSDWIKDGAKQDIQESRPLESNPYGFSEQEQRDVELSRERSRRQKELQSTPSGGLNDFIRAELKKNIDDVNSNIQDTKFPEQRKKMDTINVPVEDYDMDLNDYPDLKVNDKGEGFVEMSLKDYEDLQENSEGEEDE